MTLAVGGCLSTCGGGPRCSSRLITQSANRSAQTTLNCPPAEHASPSAAEPKREDPTARAFDNTHTHTQVPMQGLWAQIRTFPQPSLLERPVVSLDAPSLFQQTAQRTLRQRHHHDSVSTLDLVHPRCRSIRGRARGNTRCWLGFILLVAVGHRAIPLSKVSEVQDRAEGLEDELSRVLYFNLLPPVLAQSASCPSISFDSGEQEHGWCKRRS